MRSGQPYFWFWEAQDCKMIPNVKLSNMTFASLLIFFIRYALV